MLRLFKVSGDSLSPAFREGDFVLIAKIPFFLCPIREGDVIVFRHERYGVMIKRVAFLEPEMDEVFVLGEGENSTDSRKFGPISRKNVLGKVIWHIRKPSS